MTLRGPSLTDSLPDTAGEKEQDPVSRGLTGGLPSPSSVPTQPQEVQGSRRGHSTVSETGWWRAAMQTITVYLSQRLFTLGNKTYLNRTYSVSQL